MQKVTATIKKVLSHKKIGFLIVKGIPRDVFFRFNKFEAVGINPENLKRGDTIDVEIREGNRGWEVSKVFSSQKSGGSTHQGNKSNYSSSRPTTRTTVRLQSRQTSEPSENFYIHLQKRMRFRLGNETDRKGRITAKQFEIYKINHGEKQWAGVLSKCNYSVIKDRLTANAEKLSETLYTKEFSPEHRLIVGLGGGSVYETSITLHHTYGFPYIPASAVKGMMRSYLITSLWGTEKDSEDKAFMESKAMCDIFGTPEAGSYYSETYKTDEQKYGISEKAGDLVFFDAFPCTAPQIASDIMNPHYPDYYGDDKNKIPPGDWQNPVPVIFLTVEKTAFQFMIGLKKGKTPFDLKFKENDVTKYDGPVMDRIDTILKNALDHHGIGAKTAVGYGYMQ